MHINVNINVNICASNDQRPRLLQMAAFVLVLPICAHFAPFDVTHRRQKIGANDAT